jgi:hypothetical protein
VAHVCNPCTQEAEQEEHEFKASLGFTERLSQKKLYIYSEMTFYTNSSFLRAGVTDRTPEVRKFEFHSQVPSCVFRMSFMQAIFKML